MGRIVSLENERTARLVAEIERALRASGRRTLAVPASSVANPERWRRAAVMAAHRLGHRASTYAVGDHLMVEVADPVTDAERRWAADVFSDLLRASRCPQG